MVVIAGCASGPTRQELATGIAPHLTDAAPAGIVDGRESFQRYFCAATDLYLSKESESLDCGNWLFLLPEGPSPATHPGQLPQFRGRVAIIPGAFSECFGAGARPFAQAPAALASQELEFAVVPVGGRSGTEHNAAQIADFLEAWDTATEGPLVIIGYSKGINDALQFLVDYPAQAARVSAVVSVAGSVRGSPLADRYATLYDLIFSYLPSNRCERGDGGVVDSLRTEERSQWLEDNPLPEHIRYYSLAAYTDRERVARSLLPTWRMLLSAGRRNDGQLLPEDALIPGSTVLGYLYADHWGAAMALEADLPMLLHRRDESTFPHDALLAAILAQLASDLQAR